MKFNLEAFLISVLVVIGVIVCIILGMAILIVAGHFLGVAKVVCIAIVIIMLSIIYTIINGNY